MISKIIMDRYYSLKISKWYVIEKIKQTLKNDREKVFLV
jgi:hypothetical protein